MKRKQLKMNAYYASRLLLTHNSMSGGSETSEIKGTDSGDCCDLTLQRAIYGPGRAVL